MNKFKGLTNDQIRQIIRNNERALKALPNCEKASDWNNEINDCYNELRIRLTAWRPKD